MNVKFSTSVNYFLWIKRNVKSALASIHKTFKMKPFCSLFYCFFALLLMNSCESDNESTNGNSEFKIEFSDGTSIPESNIAYYDSSSHLLFLKKEYQVKGPGEFDVKVDNQVIYHGGIHACILSSPPKTSTYISDCRLYSSTIIEIGCTSVTADFRNHPTILSALEENNLLSHGITCEIVNITVNNLENSSEVTTTLKLKNHDNINYYIPDPRKMGNLKFNYYNGGTTLIDTDTQLYNGLRWSVSSPDWDHITMDHLTLLLKREEITFTFKSADYSKIISGQYEGKFRFNGVNYKASEFNLSQKDGRIWVGVAPATLKNITVD